MNFLPDTNVIINFLKGYEPDKSFLEKLIISGKLHISFISVAEFISGATPDDEEKFSEFCNIAEMLMVDGKIAKFGGDYRKKYSKKVKKAYLVDCLIAASCKAYELQLITNDTKDYPMNDIEIVKPK